MIVISGALVLVAAVLLVLGIVSSITLVYAAIGLSLVSAVFLLVGVFQRPAPVAEGASFEQDEPTRAAPPVRPAKPKEPEPVYVEPEPVVDDYDDDYSHVDAAADYPLEAANADFETRAEATGADVLVISGRPRYHVGGCEYVEGHEGSEPLEIVEARELGFTPCGVCRPNETLALSAAGRVQAPSPTPTPAPAPSAPAPVAHVAPPPPPVVVTAPATVAAQAVSPVQSNGSNGDHPVPVAPQPVAQVAAPAPLAPPVAEPAVAPAEAPPVRTPRKRASRAKKPVEPAQQELAVESVAPAEPAPPPAAAAPPARARISARTVFAVAETKEYHRVGCELLANVTGEELTKGAAIRQGYLACGVCKP